MAMELWGSDPYRNNPVVSSLWNSAGVIPVLPPHPELGLFSVLRKAGLQGHYNLIGDLGSLCAVEGLGKALLQKMVAEAELDNPPQKLFTTRCPRTEDQTWSLEMLALLGFTFGAEGRRRAGHTSTTVHEQEVVSASTQTVLDMLKAFLPDSSKPSLKATRSEEGSVVELFVVQQVVRARQIDVMVATATPSAAGKKAAAGSPLLNVNVELYGNFMGNDIYRNYQITGRDAQGNNSKPIVVAFSGVRATYLDGILVSANPSSEQTDFSAGNRREDGPLDDDNLREFVDQPNWYATIDSGKKSWPYCCDHLGIMCTIL